MTKKELIEALASVSDDATIMLLSREPYGDECIKAHDIYEFNDSGNVLIANKFVSVSDVQNINPLFITKM